MHCAFSEVLRIVGKEKKNEKTTKMNNGMRKKVEALQQKAPRKNKSEHLVSFMTFPTPVAAQQSAAPGSTGASQQPLAQSQRFATRVKGSGGRDEARGSR